MTSLNTMTPAQLNSYVSSARRNDVQFHRMIDVQQTETYKRGARNFEKLIQALNADVSNAMIEGGARVRKLIAKPGALIWECYLATADGSRVFAVTFDCVAGQVRVYQCHALGYKRHGNANALDAGLTFAQIAACVNAIMA